jgi:hypothetical protein
MHATIYTLAQREKHWRVTRDGQFLAAFSEYEVATAFVQELVKTDCLEGKASEVIVEDEPPFRPSADRLANPEGCGEVPS